MDEVHASAWGKAQQAVQGHGLQINNYGQSMSEPVAVSIDLPLGRRDERYELRGRESLLATLDRHWQSAGGSRVHVLCGLGGIGKSRAALEFAHMIRSHGVDVWWLTATDSGQLSAGMQALAYRMGVPTQDLKRGDLADLLWQRLSAREQPWLLVVDNADDLDVLGVAGRSVAEGVGWIRPVDGASGMVVVTSRDGRRARWGSWSSLYPIERLSEEAAVQVLVDYVGPDAGTPAEALELAKRMGCLPLGLRLVGSYLARIRDIPAAFAIDDDAGALRSFGEYLAALQAGRTRIESAAAEGDLSQEDAQKIIRWPWQHSLTHLESTGVPYAGSLLTLLAVLEDAPIPHELLLVPSQLAEIEPFTGITGPQIWQVLTALADFGLIEIDVSRRPPTVLVHPLVRATTGSGDQSHHDQYRYVAAELLCAAAQSDATGKPEEPARWPLWQALTPHTSHLLLVSTAQSHTADKPVIKMTRAADLVARALSAQGFYQQAERLHHTIGQIRAALLGAEHPDMLITRHLMAFAVAGQGRYREAEAEYRAVLEAEVRLLGPEHLDTLATRHAVAHAVAGQGRYREAEAEYRAVLEAEVRLLGAEHPETLAARHEVARMVAGQGRHGEAETEYRAVLEASIRVLGAEHPDTLTTRHEVARLVAEQGRHGEAEAEYRGVLEAKVRVLGAEHPDTLATRHLMAHTAAGQGRYREAVAEYRGVLEAKVRVLGTEHPSTEITRASLAALLLELG
ncbi:tetratricopeptide repeat protein [Herbidospora sp. RD11066]